MQVKGLNLIDPMKLAWLLRADLRQGMPASASIPDWFDLWWNIEGMREYPAWENHVSNNRGLCEPLSDWPTYGRFGMTPALKYILERRDDLQEAFEVSTQAGQWQAIAWFFTHGIREYKLANRIDADVLAAIDETPPFLQGEYARIEPELTWQMYFAWMCSDELKSTFDLRKLDGRRAYLQWFLFEGVPSLNLSSLVSQRWKDWLKEPLKLEVIPQELPRAAYLLWNRRPDLRANFDIYSPEGAAGLAAWLNTAEASCAPLIWWTDDQFPSKSISKAVRPFGVNLIGFAFGELGIGEDIRMAAAACDAACIPYSVVNIDPGKHLRQEDRELENVISSGVTEAPFAINIFALTGFDTARVALERGPQLFTDRKNIGWWPWELPVWPNAWTPAFDLVDEIWAATEFTRKMYCEAVNGSSRSTSVTLMPLPVSVARVNDRTREELGLPKEAFLFLYVFDFNSYLERKNPFAVLEAFRLAFPNSDRSVGLVLKTMNSDPKSKSWRKFVSQCRRDDRIRLLTETMDRGNVLGLIRSCDAYVSLHRAEGFGRTLAEAMLFGKPVVGTNFSGVTDFLTENTGFPVNWTHKYLQEGDYPFVSHHDKAWWADPDVGDAAQQLKASRDSAYQRKFYDRIKRSATRQFSPARIGILMRTRIETIFNIR